MNMPQGGITMNKLPAFLTAPIRVHADVVKEEKRRLKKIIKCFFRARKQKIKPNRCVKLILKHLRYFLEIDKKVNNYAMTKKIPTDSKEGIFYKASCEMVHNSSQLDEHKGTKDKKNLTSLVEVSIIHIFKISLYLASSQYSMGKDKVEKVLRKKSLPLNEYGIDIIEKEMKEDMAMKKYWIRKV